MNWSPAFDLAAFLVVTLGLLALPFVPVVREWRRPTDAGALPVSADYATDIDHFARRFHAAAQEAMQDPAPRAGGGFSFVNGRSLERLESGGKRPLLARDDIDSIVPLRIDQPLYVDGNLKAARSSAFTAVYTAGNLELGSESRITEWGHADVIARLGPRCGAVRRLSAGVAVELGRGCWFERIQAPAVRAVSAVREPAARLPAPQLCASLSDLPGMVAQAPGRFLVDGDCALPSGRRYVGSLVVRGFLTIGARTTIVGDIKARDGVGVGRESVVEGALTCDNRVYVLPDARTFGPLVSESDVLIGAGAVVGTPSEPTTVSARNIIMEEGATVHGEIWAHVLGMVKAV